MPNWTKVLVSTAHGEDVAKRHNWNQHEVGPASPTSQPTSLVFTLREASFLHTCHWMPGDKESKETRVVRPKAVPASHVYVWLACQVSPLVPISPTTPTSISYKYPLFHSVKGRKKRAKVASTCASTCASTSRFCRNDTGVRFWRCGGLPSLPGVHIVTQARMLYWNSFDPDRVLLL
jgi:hypothetical protein